MNLISKTKISVCFLLIVLILTNNCFAEEKFADIDRLISTGKYSKALKTINHYEQTLLDSELLTTWEKEFKSEVKGVTHDLKNFYYLENRKQQKKIVVCISLDSGKTLWTRKIGKIGGLTPVVGPQMKILYLYNNKEIILLSTDSGAIIDRYNVPVNVESLFFDNEENFEHLPITDYILTYNPVNKSTKVIGTKKLFFTTPDKQFRIVKNKKNWGVIRLADNKKMVSLVNEFWNYVRPYWNGNNPVIVYGAKRRVLSYVDLTTGVEKWSTVLGWGYYKDSQGVSALTIKNKTYFLTIEGNKRLFIVNSENGYPVATPKLAENYLIQPFQHKDNLIVASSKWIRSFSIKGLLEPEKSIDALLQIKKALSHIGVDEKEAAQRKIDYLLERAPHLKQALLTKAKICRSLKTPDEMYYRLRALSLSGETFDDILKQKCGLIKVFNLQSHPSRSLKKIGKTVFYGTWAGDLWGLSTSNLDIGLVAQKKLPFVDIDVRTELKSLSGDLNQFSEPIPEAYDYTVKKKDYNKRWIGGGLVENVSYKGRKFNPVEGGIEIISNNETVKLPSLIGHIEKWRIYLGGNVPIGYGPGIFELNQNLQPSKWIVKKPIVNGKVFEHIQIKSLNSTMNTIGIVIGGNIQVYSYSGELLNETAIKYSNVSNYFESKLMTLRDGYFLSNSQLVWIGINKTKKTWKFDPYYKKRYRRNYFQNFGNPILGDGCIYVSDVDGFLYIFDSDFVTGSNK